MNKEMLVVEIGMKNFADTMGAATNIVTDTGAHLYERAEPAVYEMARREVLHPLVGILFDVFSVKSRMRFGRQMRHA